MWKNDWSLVADALHCNVAGLRPSKQIRSPIYSFKQRALRKRIIVKYGILYACVFAFFAALVILPVRAEVIGRLLESLAYLNRLQLVFQNSINLNNCSICDNI